jgi:uncharacterized membrane protein
MYIVVTWKLTQETDTETDSIEELYAKDELDKAAYLKKKDGIKQNTLKIMNDRLNDKKISQESYDEMKNTLGFI